MVVSLARIKKSMRQNLRGQFTRVQVDTLVASFVEEVRGSLLRGEGVQVHGICTLIPTLTTGRNVFCIQDKKIKKTSPRWKLRMVVSPKFRSALIAHPKRSPFRRKKSVESAVSKD